MLSQRDAQEFSSLYLLLLRAPAEEASWAAFKFSVGQFYRAFGTDPNNFRGWSSFCLWDWLWKPHQTETQWWWSLGSSGCQQCQTGMMNSSSLATHNSTTDGDVPGTRNARGSQWLIQHPQTLNKETRKKKHTQPQKPSREKHWFGELF